MAIKSFDRDTLRTLSAEIEAALQAVARKNGVSLKVGRGQFSPQNFTLKVEGSLLEDGGEAVTKEKNDFNRYATTFGLKPEDLGRRFVFRGQPYGIVGLKLSSRKYPILGKSRSGKVYKFQAEDVRLALAGNAPVSPFPSAGGVEETDFDVPADE